MRLDTVLSYCRDCLTAMSGEGLTDVEDRFRETRDWEGRTYQQYSLNHEINLAPIDDVSRSSLVWYFADRCCRMKQTGLRINML